MKNSKNKATAPAAQIVPMVANVAPVKLEAPVITLVEGNAEGVAIKFPVLEGATMDVLMTLDGSWKDFEPIYLDRAESAAGEVGLEWKVKPGHSGKIEARYRNGKKSFSDWSEAIEVAVPELPAAFDFGQEAIASGIFKMVKDEAVGDSVRAPKGKVPVIEMVGIEGAYVYKAISRSLQENETTLILARELNYLTNVVAFKEVKAPEGVEAANASSALDRLASLITRLVVTSEVTKDMLIDGKVTKVTKRTHNVSALVKLLNVSISTDAKGHKTFAVPLHVNMSYERPKTGFAPALQWAYKSWYNGKFAIDQLESKGLKAQDLHGLTAAAMHHGDPARFVSSMLIGNFTNLVELLCKIGSEGFTVTQDHCDATAGFLTSFEARFKTGKLHIYSRLKAAMLDRKMPSGESFWTESEKAQPKPAAIVKDTKSKLDEVVNSAKPAAEAFLPTPGQRVFKAVKRA